MIFRKLSFFCIAISLCFSFAPAAQATHIHYLDYADISSDNPVSLSAGQSYTYAFNLTTDNMLLSEVSSGADLGIGSYDPAENLHYVYLKIDPNNRGRRNSGALEVKVNGTAIPGWENAIPLYGWGVPRDNPSDPFNIIGSYIVSVEVTACKDVTVTNINLEGCFDSAVATPAPATIFLLGPGLFFLAGFKKRLMKI